MKTDNQANTYEIATLYANNAPQKKELLISLEYPDWCRFEKTQLYQDLIAYLERLKIPNSTQKTLSEAQ